VGHPARSVGAVCRCGEPLLRLGADGRWPERLDVACPACKLPYRIDAGRVEELAPPG